MRWCFVISAWSYGNIICECKLDLLHVQWFPVNSVREKKSRQLREAKSNLIFSNNLINRLPLYALKRCCVFHFLLENTFYLKKLSLLSYTGLIWTLALSCQSVTQTCGTLTCFDSCMFVFSKVKELEEELHVVTNSLRSLEISENKVCCWNAELMLSCSQYLSAFTGFWCKRFPSTTKWMHLRYWQDSK